MKGSLHCAIWHRSIPLYAPDTTYSEDRLLDKVHFQHRVVTCSCPCQLSSDSVAHHYPFSYIQPVNDIHVSSQQWSTTTHSAITIIHTGLSKPIVLYIQTNYEYINMIHKQTVFCAVTYRPNQVSVDWASFTTQLFAWCLNEFVGGREAVCCGVTSEAFLSFTFSTDRLGHR